MASLMYAFAVESFLPALQNLAGLLDKAAEQLGAEADALAGAQLAPDMFPLTRQVQIASDAAKSAVARLTGREPPKFEDAETTIADLKARIEKTIAFIQSVPASEFEGADTREVAFPLRDGKGLKASGVDFLKDWALPNFYFHLVTAYDILRSKGVQIGKTDYLAQSGGKLVVDLAA